jgi:hypothetical protein
MKKVTLVLIVLINFFTLTAQNQSDVGVSPAITTPIPQVSGEIFRFKTGIATHFHNGNLPTGIGTIGFGANDRWNAFGKINGAAQILYGFRTQTNARGLTMGLGTNTAGTTVGDPFIEWIGNDQIFSCTKPR